MPSRLIGKEVQIRLYADWAEVYYKGHLVEGMERMRGEGEANVNYRRVIGALPQRKHYFYEVIAARKMLPKIGRRWRGGRHEQDG